MIPPLVDTHCHLLAGLDDGPPTPDVAIEMCRKAYEQGVRHTVALAHQNDDYPENTPQKIRLAFLKLQTDLAVANLPMDVVVCSEVMARPDMIEAWSRGEFVSYGEQGKYLLVEMPHGLCVEIGWIVERLMALGVRPILAHAERVQELQEFPEAVEKLIRQGCIIQVSTQSITDPVDAREAKVLKDWFRRGIAHVLGSDGHSVHRRPPDMADAYETVKGWAGVDVANRVASTHGLAILRSHPLKLPPVIEAKRKWFEFWK